MKDDPACGQTNVLCALCPSSEASSAFRSEATLTYPYQSKDIYTLKNRANKVRERILDCSNQGELVSLYAQGLITATEVDWLKGNLLSKSECDCPKGSGFANHLARVEATVQSNLFDQDEHEQLKAQTTKEIRRIGWSKKQGIKCIKERYGVSDRALMSIEQLIDFRDYLRTLPSK